MKKKLTVFSLMVALLLAATTVSGQPAPELLGWMYKYGDFTGSVSFKADEPASVTTLKQTSYDALANAGSAVIDGKVHCINANTEYLSLGFAQIFYYCYDLETWTLVGSRKSLSDYTMIAYATTQDKVNNVVYGEFYNATATGMEWGTIDYEQQKRTSTFGTAEHQMVALGVTRAGKLYGIATDGNLYKIDTTTGQETSVGYTGLSIYKNQPNAGQIDQSTDTFYFVYADGTSAASLYTIDLETAAATKLGDLPEGKQLYCLSVLGDVIDTAGPAVPTNLTADFQKGSTTGTISFTVPTETSAGKPLAGDLSYTIKANDEVIATGSTTAGAEETVNVTAPEGMVTFAVSVTGNGIEGAVARTSLFVGFGTPKAVTGVNLSIDSETGEATVTWAAPTETEDGGYLGKLTYRIVRYPEQVVVAKAHTETSFTETLDDGIMMFYQYGVVAVNSGKQSQESITAKQAYGSNGMGVPYEVTFRNDAEQVELFTIVDANKDGKTWYYDKSNKVMRTTTGKVASDDWLFSPGFQLKTGYTYHVGVHAKTYLNSYPTKMVVWMGNGKNAEGMTMKLEEAELTTNQYEWYGGDVTVDAEGIFFVGMHDVSETSGFSTFVDGMKIEVISSPEAPDSVRNLQIVTDESGALKATLSFIAPTTAVNGTPLETIDRIEILRDGALVNTIGEVTPGQEFAGIEDNDIESDGYKTYTLMAYSDGRKGLRREMTVFAGVDIPAAAENLWAKDNLTSITLGWDEASTVGANGGRVIPEEVSAYIYGNDMVTRLGEATTNTFSIDSITTEGAQHVALFYVRAFNRVGASGYWRPVRIVVGTPYELPYRESFASGKASTLGWTEGSLLTTSINPSYAADADGGSYALLTNDKGEGGSYNTGKISLKDATNPKLSYNFRSTPGLNVLFKTIVLKQDGTADTLQTINLRDLPDSQWQQVKLSLAQYTEEPYVVVKFRIENNDGSARLMTLIDNIQIVDMLDNDLAVAVHAPQMTTLGHVAGISVDITNEGDNDATGYTLRVSCNDQVIAEDELTETIPSLAGITRSYDYQTSSLTDVNGKLEIKAEVIYADDQNTGNDMATAEVELFDAEASPAENLAVTGGTSENDPVRLTWNEPSNGQEKVMEGFEEYGASLTAGFGDWTPVDMDHGAAGKISAGAYGHENEEFAFMTFNPSELGMLAKYPALSPHSGSLSLMAILSFKDGSAVDANDWLISPELPGEEQAITFWANNINTTESISVLYSTTDTSVESFSELLATTVGDGQWKQVEATLPEGAKYFAVQRHTEAANSMLLLLDDFFFVRSAAPVGYNIYRDGQLIATVQGETCYEDEPQDNGSYDYAVTAVYADGCESAPISDVIDITTGILTAKPLTPEFDRSGIYDLQGRRMNRFVGNSPLKKGVYVIGGKKVVVK